RGPPWPPTTQLLSAATAADAAPTGLGIYLGQSFSYKDSAPEGTGVNAAGRRWYALIAQNFPRLLDDEMPPDRNRVMSNPTNRFRFSKIAINEFVSMITAAVLFASTIES